MLIPLDIPPGINSDDTAFAAKGRWADGSNVRFRNGRPEVVGGWARLINTTFTNARAAYGASDASFVAIASSAAPQLQVYVASTATVYDISPAAWGANTATRYSFAQYGSYLVACAVGSSAAVPNIVYWDGNTANDAIAVPNAPNRAQHILVTPQRQLLAFGCSEEVSGTRNLLCIRGSDIEDITDWTTTASNNVFEHILENCGSQILDARMVGDYVLVWTDTSLVLGTFVGDPSQTYRFEKIGSDCGVKNHGAAVVAGRTAYWFSSDLKLWTWAPGALPTQIPSTIWVDLKDNYAAGLGIGCQAWYNPIFDEVWLLYWDGRDGSSTGAPSFSRYVAYSISEKAWFRGQAQRYAAGRGALSSGSAPAGLRPFMIDANGRIVAHEAGDTADGSSLTWHLQSADQYFENSRRRMMVKGVIPDFEDQAGDVSLTLYVRDRPQSTATTKGPYTLGTSTTKKDFRASGKIIAAKFSGTAFMRLGRPMFDGVPMGER